MKLIFRALAIAVLATVGQVANAGFHLEIASVPGTITAPGTVSLDVFAWSDLGTQPISGFDLKFDLLGPGGTFVGAGLPTGVSIAAVNPLTNPFITLGFGTTLLTPNSAPLPDFYVNGDRGGPTQDILEFPANAKTRLFTLNFDIANTTPSGTYTLAFMPTAGGVYGVYDAGGGNINLDSQISGTFTVSGITAVPEPSSMALVGLCAVGFAVRKRFKKRAPQA